MLDRLEKEAMLELQLELAGLLAERTHLLDDQRSDAVREWRRRLRGQAAGSHEAAAAATEESLDANRRSLMRARASFLAGLPSDERSETVGVVWENAMLRAEVEAGRQALTTLADQLDELAHTMKEGSGASADSLVGHAAELQKAAAARAKEQGHAMERLGAWAKEEEPPPSSAAAAGGAAGGAPADGGKGKGAGAKYHYLARLVPELMRLSSASFAATVDESRALLSRHKAEREKLCGRMRLDAAAEAPPHAATTAATAAATAATAAATAAATSSSPPPRTVPPPGTRALLAPPPPPPPVEAPVARRERSLDRLQRWSRSFVLGRRDSRGSRSSSSRSPLADVRGGHAAWGSPSTRADEAESLRSDAGDENVAPGARNHRGGPTTRAAAAKAGERGAGGASPSFLRRAIGWGNRPASPAL